MYLVTHCDRDLICHTDPTSVRRGQGLFCPSEKSRLPGAVGMVEKYFVTQPYCACLYRRMTALRLASPKLLACRGPLKMSPLPAWPFYTLSEEYGVRLVVSRLWTDQCSILGSLPAEECKSQGHYIAAQITPVVTLLVMALIVE